MHKNFTLKIFRADRPFLLVDCHMARPISPYHAPGFYADALSKGGHRDIVGGRWDETGRAQMAVLLEHGLQPDHHLLDIGAGSLRLGCKAVPYLNPGHYWATDMSGDLLLRGYDLELADPARLPQGQLIEDADFNFPGVCDTITHAIAFAVFTHLPGAHLHRALTQIRVKFPALQKLLFTVFLAPDPANSLQAYRQQDGVVTHKTRAPYHLLAHEVMAMAQTSGFSATLCNTRLPRGQRLYLAKPA